METTTSVLEVIGFAILVLGVALLSIPIGCIILGAGLMGFGYLAAPAQPKRKATADEVFR